MKADPKKTPSAFASQQLHHIDPADHGMAAELRGIVAMVIDKKAGAYAVTLRVSGRQFGLLERHEQDWQLAQWGNILGQFVSERPTISQIQWSEWAAPSGTWSSRVAWSRWHLSG